MATKKFKCKVCGYVHEGNEAPEKCPLCGAAKSEFEEIVEEGAAPAKKGIDTSSNVYTIIYAAVMVILVAFLLVFVSSTLKERQTANVINDTKAQILAALNIKDQADVAQAYANTIQADMLMQADGTLVPYDGEFCTGYSAEYDAGRLHVFQASKDGQTKYVIPMNGLGLWGVIWGYIALDQDRSSVYGVYFSHASETPGLGGEIAAPLFQSRFPGKIVTDNGQVALQVVKFGKADKNSPFQVDGVTGATITSTGVNAMINKVLSSYLPFLCQQCQMACCQEHEGECSGDGDCANCTEHNVESNE